ncbi:MAG: hypothetical protein PVH89_05735 [Gammaproteobacteria bacterium]
MKTITMTILAIAAAASLDAVQADEAPATEVIVVTAKRPAPIKTTPVIAAEAEAPAIDYTRLAIQAPVLDRSDTGAPPRRVELAVADRVRTTT